VSAIVRVIVTPALDDADAGPLVGTARAIAAASSAAVEVIEARGGPGVDEHVEALGAALDRAPRALVTILNASDDGNELAARLAVRLDGAALGRCTAIGIEGGQLRVERAAFGGRARATLTSQGNAFATMRPAKGAAAPVATARVVEVAPPRQAVERREVASGRRRLEGARIVVSGGRGMAGPEGFAQLEALGKALDAAVGGSLPAVDAGWVPVAHQVGQSGKFVTPEVYVAVAISGTPQHLAGIGSDTRIVAINKDADADIFKAAEVGIVGDWREVVPALIEKLK
jgi:electron transfer flavoprotein alpha subunit